MILGFGAQPYRGAIGQQQVEIDRIGYQAAGGADHHFGINLYRFLQRAPLVTPVGGVAVEVLNFRDSAAGKLFDFAAEFDKRETEIVCKQLSKRRFARATETYQGYSRAGCAALGCGAQGFADGEPYLVQRLFVTVFQQGTDHQPLWRSGGKVADQFGQRAVQGVCHLYQHQYRSVAFAVLEIGQVPLRYAGRLR